MRDGSLSLFILSFSISPPCKKMYHQTYSMVDPREVDTDLGRQFETLTDDEEHQDEASPSSGEGRFQITFDTFKNLY